MLQPDGKVRSFFISTNTYDKVREFALNAVTNREEAMYGALVAGAAAQKIIPSN